MYDDRIERYLMELDLPFEKTGETTWVVNDEIDNIDNIVIYNSPPIVIFSVKLMRVPATNKEDFYLALLELNAELVHGKYSIEGDFVTISDSLESENLDLNEFKATFYSMTMAITGHYDALKKYTEN